MAPVRVFLDHREIGVHPDGSTRTILPDETLRITEPDGTTHDYRRWHAAGAVPCGWAEPDESCPNCNPPEPE